jgi:hypothetical protein
MSCSNTTKLKEMLVGIDVMFHMAIHTFQEVLLTVDQHTSLCDCEDCLKLEEYINQAKSIYEDATLTYWTGSQLCEIAFNMKTGEDNAGRT